MKYDVAVDMAVTVHYEVEAENHDEAYEKAVVLHNNDDMLEIPHYYICEEYFYVEDQNGIQIEY